MAALRSRPAILRLAAALAALAVLIGVLPSTRAQSNVRYFPETGHNLGGLFRYFWESNGSIDNFGYPITEEFQSSNGRLVQWFERARFELVGSGAQSTVELGNLGIEATQGRTFPKVPPVENTADQRYIPATQHIIKYGFKEIWETRGAARIFGNPISEEIQEVLDDGEWHTVQYFEKVRFEYWPNLAPGKRVLITHLGRRLAPAERTSPVSPPAGAPQPTSPAPQPTAAPAAPAQPLPASTNARVQPDSGPPGTTFVLDAYGFQPGEMVGIWLTAPDQSTFGADFQAQADDQGSIAHEQIGIATDSSFPVGVWSFNAQGVESKRQAVGYFRISNTVAAGDPNKLGVIVHDQLQRSADAYLVPIAAPPGIAIYLIGRGFDPNETVSVWFTGADGRSTAVPDAQIMNDAGVVQAALNTGGLPEGIYTAVAHGRGSNREITAAFKLTRDYIAGPGTPRPASVNGSSTPPEAAAGSTFQIRGQNLMAGEPVELWITDPSGSYTWYPNFLTADGNGRIGYTPALDLKLPATALPGVYGIHFRGRTSGVRVDAYFTATSAEAKGTIGNASWLQDQIGAWMR